LAPGTAANPATITVYNNTGVTWGWQNFFFPNVNEQQFIADVDADVFGEDQLGEFTVDLDGDNPPGMGSVPTTVELVNPSQYGLYEQDFARSVPEPSTWAMLLLGFAGLGYAGYRRSKRRAIFA
jgi:PEP-CTERM motif